MADDLIDDDDDGDLTTVKPVERSDLNSTGEEPGEDYALTQCPEDLECAVLEVTGANYARCNGEYKFIWYRRPGAPDRPIYKHTQKKRFIFWQSTPGYGWSIGPKKDLTGSFHSSG